MYNEINCEVIRDLLPPYAYGLANPATCALVDGHLETCESCGQALEQLRNEEETTPPPPGEALGRVKKKIKRKKLRNALLSVIAAIAVLCTGFYFVFMQSYPLPYREGDFSVERRNEESLEPDDDGQLMLSEYRANCYLSLHGGVQHINTDGSILVVRFVRLMKYTKLHYQLNGMWNEGPPDGEWQGSTWLNWSPDDGDYTLKEKPAKVTCRVYYLEDFGKLRLRATLKKANHFIASYPGEEPAYDPSELLPYELSEEVLKYCTLIWEGDITEYAYSND